MLLESVFMKNVRPHLLKRMLRAPLILNAWFSDSGNTAGE
jgi:hypothetical protein